MKYIWLKMRCIILIMLYRMLKNDKFIVNFYYYLKFNSFLIVIDKEVGYKF